MLGITVGTARQRRSASVQAFTNVQKLYSGGAVTSQNQTDLNLFDHAYCEDELNEMALLGQAKYDIGGNLLSLKAWHDFPVAAQSAMVDAFGVRWTGDGPCIALPTVAHTYNLAGDTWWGWVDNAGLDSTLQRIGLGATAISRCRPSKPHASVGVAVVEALREGIPNTLRQLTHLKDETAKFRELSRTQKGKEIPSKYLEHQFGWLPLVSDVRKATQALVNYEKILEDLRRNSGKRMRRRYTFPASTEVSEYQRDWIGPWPSYNSYLVQQAGQRVITQKKTKSTWFSGEFVYTYPSADAAIPQNIMHGARQLLGIDFTPETLWNVAPWTWLADWFANTGDVVANFTAIGSDNLVMRYGYLMQEAQASWIHTHTGVTIQGTGWVNKDISGTFSVRAKSRIAASPFGFGLTYDSLSPRQIAILTSIGITRRGRH